MPRKPTGNPPGRRPQRGEKAARSLHVKVTPDEYARIVARAAARDMSVSEYVRERCLDD